MSHLDSGAGAVPAQDEGHPPGLYMLFFAEMWERFCFYGMRALLVLYMTKAFLYSDDAAYGVYGNYNSLVYLSPVIGGYIADRLLGYRAAILLGGLLMAIGEFTLLVEQEFAFYAGMAMIICGNGLFKPNISTLVGKLYREGDSRRDAGFTIFYMGINLGALASTLLCGYIGENFGWTYGFGLAGIGMLAGLVTFAGGRARLQGEGEPPAPERQPARLGMVVAGVVVLAPVIYWLLQNPTIVQNLLLAMIGLAMAYMLWTAFRSDRQQRERLFVLIVLWIFHMLFWAFFEQAGSSLTLYTDRVVDRDVFGWTFPTTWGQFFNPAFILIFGAIFSVLWVRLGRAGKEPSIPMKFALAQLQLGLGYGVLVMAAQLVGGDSLVSLGWLVLCYLLHTTGELCLSPVGLSAVTKLAPKHMTGVVMGIWFLSISAGHKLAAKIAGETSVPEGASTQQALDTYTGVYSPMFQVSIGAGVVLIILTPLLKKWLHGVK